MDYIGTPLFRLGEVRTLWLNGGIFYFQVGALQLVLGLSSSSLVPHHQHQNLWSNTPIAFQELFSDFSLD